MSLLLLYSGHINLNESLFTYPDGLTAANFTYPDHMPVFMDELSESTISEARGVCGNSTQCIYDLTQTGNVELAMTTLAVNEENLEEETLAGIIYTYQLIILSMSLKLLLYAI